jgi:glycosyltransferase involved in cell wall biosynthesis
LVPSFFKSPLKFDAIFPFPIDTKERRKTICWIPDFQEIALPHLFSAEELSFRTNQHQYYIENFDNILFSSHAALADFDRFYPDAKNKKHVMQFAVAEVPVIPGIASVLKRLGLPDVFFYCPNQFWLHKNHKAVIEAVRILRNNGASVTVAFSGKELDRRDPDHVDKLKHRVVELGLEKEIKFLGFISKEDQYALLDSAVAMIQPSLFEGWSTVVEEAKSKSCYVLASDIPVHREQLNSNASFFDPEDPAELAAAMEVRLSKPSDHNAIDYNSNRRNFAITFMEIVDSLKRSS